jgi:fluoride exporter
MTLALVVALVAAVGASCRYVVDQFIQHQHDSVFPWGTFAINIVGSFVLGVVTGSVSHHGLSATAAAVIGAGFCAGFTTFSTWMWETLALSESGAMLEATLNVVGSLAVGLAAAAAGFALVGGV